MMPTWSRNPWSIPLELWDMIISHVDCENSLLDCALVCRTWRPAARQHRFNVVRITPQTNEREPRESPLLLSDPSSTILPYVRRIDLVEGVVPKSVVQFIPAIQSPSDAAQYGGIAWLDDILPTIRVHDLTALQWLDLLELCWEELSADSRANLKYLCRRLTTLRHFTCSQDNPARRCALAVELLDASPSLRTFTFHYHEATPTGVATLADDAQPLDLTPYYGMRRTAHPLTKLILSGHLGPIVTCLNIVHPNLRLEELSLAAISPDDEGTAISLLQSCAETLTFLSLLYSKKSYEPMLCSGAGISRMIALQTFTIMADLQFVPAILRHIPSRSLKHLTMNAAPQTLSKTDLGDLTRVLTMGSLAASRPRVTIICWPEKVAQESEDPVALQNMRDILVASLKDLHKDGRLEMLRVLYKDGCLSGTTEEF
ncbi:uncharacterized protein B0H18DRAFT_1044225 [Fomitopsis serialis]|uniref:uncharacterized protein n=1 Tax=Fomitopsis serialis TaxID=139415 RepID=UPI002008B426|nr:uncharacterized protein B0H18DRAFT_1044225 [Neoantrodia serialis]KAH9914684.1 hypothetical protein B0H18DRAFT_1044225 [Neoantrodia serialis]